MLRDQRKGGGRFLLGKLCSAINVKLGEVFVGKIMLGEQRKGGGRFLLVKLCSAINVSWGEGFCWLNYARRST